MSKFTWLDPKHLFAFSLLTFAFILFCGRRVTVHQFIVFQERNSTSTGIQQWVLEKLNVTTPAENSLSSELFKNDTLGSFPVSTVSPPPDININQTSTQQLPLPDTALTDPSSSEMEKEVEWVNEEVGTYLNHSQTKPQVCVPYDPNTDLNLNSSSTGADKDKAGGESVPLGKNSKPFDPQTCEKSQFTEIANSGMLVYKANAKSANVTCCLKVKIPAPVDPKKKKDKKPKLIDACLAFPPSGQLDISQQLDFLEIFCTKADGSIVNQTEIRVQFRPKSVAESKKKYWEGILSQKSKEENATLKKPPSVLLLGLSSLSRDQARSLLPRTTELLVQKMGFLAYEKYVRSGEGMAKNLFPMLTGHSLAEGCGVKTKGSKECKLILETFNQLKYVSVGGVQGSFYLPEPFKMVTDYTFIALMDSYHTGMTKKPHTCYHYNVFQEILSFGARFLNHYKSVPYFATIWLDLFNKQLPNSLPASDELLHSFFSKHTKDFENTLVILVSDGGTYENQDLRSQGYFGNNFPFLYIHFPKYLQEEAEAAGNQGKPISSLDIHNTIEGLHGACHKFKDLPAEFTKLCNDSKVSTPLWEPIESERVCEALGIFESSCRSICNGPIPDPEPISTESLEDIAMNFMNFLNQFIDDAFNAEKRVICTHWILEVDGIVYSSVLRSGSIVKNGTLRYNWKEVLIVVRVQPAMPNQALGQTRTKFEGVVRIYTLGDRIEMRVIGSPRRIPEIGEFPHKYSACVKGQKDVELDSLCYCKPKARLHKHTKGHPDY